ncbi:tRNA(Ile)-lysidine synthase [Anaerococcus prevotii]|nr:tRNA lysidine(34) synthetase TilS [Anaerococcus prevotii]SUU94226.1 tRNA(Ile)-lysidine synthase [Anaerococcus prevotii]
MKMTIINKVRETIRANGLIEEGDTIIVGASGGPDSQFLIYALMELRKEMDFTIILAHLNHLHRKEANFDESLVEETAEKFALSFRKKAASMDAYAKKYGISSEDAGRRLRYEFFREIQKEYPKSKIAIAHNLDDQAETVLMRIIRGTGVEGLRAMDYRNGDIIRPILDIKKAMILDYLNSEQIPYAIDKTNFTTDYTRNKLRLDIIPKIEKINPNFKESLVKLSEIATDEISISDSYIKNIYEDIIIQRKIDFVSFDKEAFESQDKAIQSRLIRCAIGEIKKEIRDISKENIDNFLSLVDLANGKSIIKDDLVFLKSYKFYKMSLRKEDSQKKTGELTINIGEELSFGGKRIKISSVSDFQKKHGKNIEYFDMDKLTFPLSVRFRKNGDKFKPIGLGHRKKIKDFFIDMKVDKEKREKIPLILSENDIIWVTSFRSSEDYKLDPSTKNIIKIEVYDED